MCKYTTGEIAKLCGVSVRTVQYYDRRSILVPGEYSEGGRRLYTDEDLKKLKIICFLREAGVPINSISELLRAEEVEQVISLLLQRHEDSLREEMSLLKEKLRILEGIKSGLKDTKNFSLESIGDIAQVMKVKKQLKKMRAVMLISGIPVTALQWAGIIIWITHGIWWLFALWCVSSLIYGIWVSKYYFSRVAYICPHCHSVFKPKFKEAFWANHTPTLRNLTCTSCGKKSFCIEIYKKETADNE